MFVALSGIAGICASEAVAINKKAQQTIFARQSIFIGIIQSRLNHRDVATETKTGGNLLFHFIGDENNSQGNMKIFIWLKNILKYLRLNDLGKGGTLINLRSKKIFRYSFEFFCEMGTHASPSFELCGLLKTGRLFALRSNDVTIPLT